jgi:hypothetical protein
MVSIPMQTKGMASIQAAFNEEGSTKHENAMYECYSKNLDLGIKLQLYPHMCSIFDGFRGNAYHIVPAMFSSTSTIVLSIGHMEAFVTLSRSSLRAVLVGFVEE